MDDAPTTDDLAEGRRVWKLITDDLAVEYKKKAQSADSSSVLFFYETFYARLFDVHPMSRAMFTSGIKSQGKFLVKMISLALNEIDDSGKINITLTKLAEAHNTRGVKAIECKYILMLGRIF